MPLDHLREDFFHLNQTKPAHEAKSPSLEGDNRRNTTFELFSRVQNSPVASYSDDIVYEVVMLGWDELKSR